MFKTPIATTTGLIYRIAFIILRNTIESGRVLLALRLKPQTDYMRHWKAKNSSEMRLLSAIGSNPLRVRELLLLKDRI